MPAAVAHRPVLGTARVTRYLARVVGTAHPDHANALLVIGQILQAQGRPRAGLPYLERAVALRRGFSSPGAGDRRSVG
jgi:hypothetical protein